MLDKPPVHTVPTTFINMNSKFHDFELLRNPEYLLLRNPKYLMPLTSMSLLSALFSLGGCIHLLYNPSSLTTLSLFRIGLLTDENFQVTCFVCYQDLMITARIPHSLSAYSLPSETLCRITISIWWLLFFSLQTWHLCISK